MKRHHFFEFTDLSWWPDIFRRLTTDLIQQVMSYLQPYKPKLELIVETIEATRTNKIVDLCSGSGGPWRHLPAQLEERLGYPIKVVLTDKYLDNSVTLKASWLQEGVSFYKTSVDALAIPRQLDGIRTIFNSFHHFKPKKAQAILQNIIKQKQSIIIFECLKRDYKSLCSVICMPLVVLLLTPFIKPFRWSRIFFTYIIPIAPLVITWDAAVSILRCYSPEELLEMIHELKGSVEYEWKAGTYNFFGGHTYLTGYPKGRSDGFS